MSNITDDALISVEAQLKDLVYFDVSGNESLKPVFIMKLIRKMRKLKFFSIRKVNLTSN